MYNRKMIFLILMCCSIQALAGKKLRVLFIGNSYTYVNNMPQIVADIATAMGDTIVWEMEAPGGAFLLDHYSTNPPTTINKIKTGNWDYVVLQEQSQQMAVPDIHMNASFLPISKLDSLINLYNNCAETIFYQTWGRKNGDSFSCYHYSTKHNWPYFCTYNSMDSLIRLRYTIMADSFQAIVSSAGALWKHIRANYPAIELYDSDESHPSLSGSYAVACSFYTTLFKKDPTQITYNYLLNNVDATNIKLAAKKVVYDSMLYWHIGEYRTEANFKYNISAGTVSFTNSSFNAQSLIWHFGDGQTDTTANPIHKYKKSGSYNVMLVATNNITGCSDTTYSVFVLFAADITQTKSKTSESTISPNPSNGIFTVNIADENTQITIQNILGQIVYQNKANGTILIDLSNQPAGLYIVHLSSTVEAFDAKIFLQ